MRYRNIALLLVICLFTFTLSPAIVLGGDYSLTSWTSAFYDYRDYGNVYLDYGPDSYQYAGPDLRSGEMFFINTGVAFCLIP